jgi:hypothetical protein
VFSHVLNYPRPNLVVIILVAINLVGQGIE